MGAGLTLDGSIGWLSVGIASDRAVIWVRESVAAPQHANARLSTPLKWRAGGKGEPPPLVEAALICLFHRTHNSFRR